MNILISGSRGKHRDYEQLVYSLLKETMDVFGNDITIIEGCCPDSADEYAEKFAKEHNLKIDHHPGEPGKYLARDRIMVSKADEVFCFWNAISKGTSYTLRCAVQNNKRVIIIPIVRV